MDRLKWIDGMDLWTEAGQAIYNADRRGLLKKVPRLRHTVAWHDGKRKMHPLEPSPSWVRCPMNLVKDAIMIACTDLGVTLRPRGYQDTGVLRAERGRRADFNWRANRDWAADAAAMLIALAEHLTGPAADVRISAAKFRKIAARFEKEEASAAGGQAEVPAGNWSRPMALTDLADRIFKNPRMTRKVKNVYGKHLRRIGRKSWQVCLDPFPENLQKAIEKA